MKLNSSPPTFASVSQKPLVTPTTILKLNRESKQYLLSGAAGLRQKRVICLELFKFSIIGLRQHVVFVVKYC